MSKAAETENDDVYKGYAVENGRIRFTSVTQISTADPETDGGCMRRWAFPYVFRKKLLKTTSLKKGANFAEQLYQYLTTGEECLSKTLQAAQKLFPAPGADLECEQRFATGKKGVDILRAIELREQLLSGKLVELNPGAVLNDIKKFAGLTIRGIPVDGAADYRHRRGEYVDEDWILKAEPSGIVVCETGDLKTMSRIHPEIIKSGPNRGDILPSYVKSSAEVCNDIQMVTYGVYSADKYPDVTHVRLSHVIANKKKREAAKRTGLVPVDELRRRFLRIEGVVAEMEGVAQATNPADIRPNVRSCDSYTHVDPTDPTGTRVLKGCGHRYYCPLSITQVGPSLMGTVEENAMSLFDQLDAPAAPSAPPPPPAPPLTGAAYDAAVAAEKERLMRSSASMRPCPNCGTARDASNTSVLADKVTIVHIGCPGAAATAPAPPPPPVNYGSIVPPDAPKQDMSDPAALVDLADPLPPEEIAKVTDPELRAKLEAHARACAEKAAKEATEKATQGGTVAWCGGSNFRLNVTTDMAMDAKYKYVCTCGKTWTLKVLKPAKEADGTHYAIIPKHKPPSAKDAQGVTPPAPSPPPAPPRITIKGPDETLTPPAPPFTSPAPPPPPAPVAGFTPPAPPASNPVIQAAPPPPPAPPTNGHVAGLDGRPYGHVVGPNEAMVNRIFGTEGIAEGAWTTAQVVPDMPTRKEMIDGARMLSTLFNELALYLESKTS